VSHSDFILTDPQPIHRSLSRAGTTAHTLLDRIAANLVHYAQTTWPRGKHGTRLPPSGHPRGDPRAAPKEWGVPEVMLATPGFGQEPRAVEESSAPL